MRGQIFGMDRTTGEGQSSGEDGPRHRVRPDGFVRRYARGVAG